MSIRWEEVAEAAAKEVGASIEEKDGTNDYQGWGVLLLYRDSHWGTLAWTYGSCGGCDSYEDMSDADRLKEFINLITWHTGETTARKHFNDSKGW